MRFWSKTAWVSLPQGYVPGSARVAVVIALGLAVLGACRRGVTHNGYPDGATRPWDKARSLMPDARGRMTAELELSYPQRKRAQWYEFELTAGGTLTVRAEIIPIGVERVRLGMELYGSDFKRIDDADSARKEKAKRASRQRRNDPLHDRDGDGHEDYEPFDPDDEIVEAHDEEATADDEFADQLEREFPRLQPGRYLLHVYLMNTRDEASIDLVATVAGAPGVVRHAGVVLPSQPMPLPPPLPLIPVTDDTPRRRERVEKPDRKPKAPEEPAPSKEPDAAKSARIINVMVVGGSTEITINRGTSHGLEAGHKGSIHGVRNGEFVLSKCTSRTCKATVKASAKEVASKHVSLRP